MAIMENPGDGFCQAVGRVDNTRNEKAQKNITGSLSVLNGEVLGIDMTRIEGRATGGNAK